MGAVMLALGLGVGAAGADPAPVTVFAAASLKTALDRIVADWAEEPDAAPVRVSYAGSSALARQIVQGAPADIFISANTDWMDRIEAEGLLVDGSRADLLGNALVLIAHDPDAAPVEITADLPLAQMLGEDRLAMALVDAVPAGIYGRAALSALGLWDSVAERVAQADNVRAALALVSRGEAPYGITYATDAHAAGNAVRVLGTFPEGSHPPIIYPAAALQDTPTSAGFLDWLRGAEARAIFADEGFTTP
jgi:molybdate transport system substrate-binding protein